MFLCGNICNYSTEQPQIVVSSIIQARQYQGSVMQMKSALSNNFNNATTMMKKSKYKKYFAQCSSSNQYFIDQQFPPNQKSLGIQAKDRKIQWKKISKLIKDCIMCQNPIKTANLQKCNLRDSYFIATISSLALDPMNIQKIFHNNFQINGYGIYKLIVKINGCPTQIVIDDYIPVYAETNRPVFTNAYGKQIWLVLLQKAWAKIKGSYGQIQNGNPHEVFNAFSLSPSFYLEFNQNQQQQIQQNIWNNLIQNTHAKSFMLGGTKPQININALLPMRVYPIIQCIEFIGNGVRNRLIKLKNMGDPININDQKNRSYKKFLDHLKINQLQKHNNFFHIKEEEEYIITFQDLFTNFNFIDICYSKKKFSYQFHNMKLENKVGKFINIQVKEAHEAYLSIYKIFDKEQKQKSKIQQHNKKLEYGLTRIVVAKCIQNQRYEYYASKLQSNFPDLSLNINFKEGFYTIMIQSVSQALIDFKGIFSYYFATLQNKQNKIISILPQWSVGKKVRYLENVFSNHSERMNDRIQRLSPRNDWIKSNLLYEQGGYGYIACHLDSQTKIKLQISINRNQIKKSGFDLEYLRSDKMQIKQGQSQIFILSCNQICRSIEQLQFPPPGFNISKIV